MLTLNLIVALLLDQLLGEARRYHPLVVFGECARRVEAFAREWVDPRDNGGLFGAGAVSWTLLVITPTFLLAALLQRIDESLAMLLSVFVLYFCIGMRSLTEHARAISRPLARGDLAAARQQLSRIVSRDTVGLDKEGVTRGAVESVLENGSDAVLAPIFWFVVAGAPGALLYRLANTLDAMWGYRSERYLYFGRMAARLDDLLNWLPARLCACGYALVGQRQPALRSWSLQAPLCDSPNAGPVMAAGAGALLIRIGGAARYNGQVHHRPELGEGCPPQPRDIERSLQLLWRTTALWLLVIAVLELML